MNYSIKLNLNNLKNAALVNIQGKTAKKQCIVIPTEDNPAIYVGAKGVYLSANVIETKERKFDDTHLIKPSLPKEVYEAMTADERNAVPIIGNMKPIESQKMETVDMNMVDQEDDLPF